jgi:hypothetical protein
MRLLGAPASCKRYARIPARSFLERAGLDGTFNFNPAFCLLPSAFRKSIVYDEGGRL